MSKGRYLDKTQAGNKSLLGTPTPKNILFMEKDRLGAVPGEYDGGTVVVPHTVDLPDNMTKSMIVRSADRYAKQGMAVDRMVRQSDLSLMKRALSYVNVKGFGMITEFIDPAHHNLTKVSFDYATYSSAASYTKLSAIATNTGDIYHPVFIEIAKLAIAIKDSVVAASNDKSIFFLMETPEIYDRILKYFIQTAIATSDYLKLLKFRETISRFETGWPALYNSTPYVRNLLQSDTFLTGLNSVIQTLGNALTGAKYNPQILAQIMSIVDYSYLPSQEGAMRVLHTTFAGSKVDAFLTVGSTSPYLDIPALSSEVAYWPNYFLSADIRDLKSNLEAIGTIPSLSVPSKVAPFVNSAVLARLNQSGIRSKGFLVPYRSDGSAHEHYELHNEATLRPDLVERFNGNTLGVSNGYRSVSAIFGSPVNPILSYPEVVSTSAYRTRIEAIDNLPNHTDRAKLLISDAFSQFVWPRTYAHAAITPSFVAMPGESFGRLRLVLTKFGAPTAHINVAVSSEHSTARYVDRSTTSLDDPIFATTGNCVLPSAASKDLLFFMPSTSGSVSQYQIRFDGPANNPIGFTAGVVISPVNVITIGHGLASAAITTVSTTAQVALMFAANLRRHFFDSLALSFGLNLPYYNVLAGQNTTTGLYYSTIGVFAGSSFAEAKSGSGFSDEPFLTPFEPFSPLESSFKDFVTVDSRISYDLTSVRYRVGVDIRRARYVAQGL